MDLTCKPEQRPDYQLEELDGELLLYHLGQTKMMYCNETASLIWRLCDGQRTVEEMITLLSTAYDQPVESITKEVTETIEQFHQHGAVALVGESG